MPRTANLAVALDRHPGVIFGAYGYLEWLIELAQQSLSAAGVGFATTPATGFVLPKGVAGRQ